MTLGGRVAEEIFFPVITTGAQDDLQKITKMAFEVCANYGMNPDIGPISYGNRDQQGEGFQKPFSEATAQQLDKAVHNMVKEAHRRTTELLTKHKSEVEKVAGLLLDKEVITREDMRNLLGPRPLYVFFGNCLSILTWFFCLPNHSGHADEMDEYIADKLDKKKLEGGEGGQLNKDKGHTVGPTPTMAMKPTRIE